MWNGCGSCVALLTVHSAWVPSVVVTLTQVPSNCLPDIWNLEIGLPLYGQGWPVTAAACSKVIVTFWSTCASLTTARCGGMAMSSLSGILGAPAFMSFGWSSLP